MALGLLRQEEGYKGGNHIERMVYTERILVSIAYMTIENKSYVSWKEEPRPKVVLKEYYNDLEEHESNQGKYPSYMTVSTRCNKKDGGNVREGSMPSTFFGHANKSCERMSNVYTTQAKIKLTECEERSTSSCAQQILKAQTRRGPTTRRTNDLRDPKITIDTCNREQRQ